MKSNSNKFGTTNHHIGENYNSINDEYRRNKILYASKKIKTSPAELFEILKTVLKKTFKIKRDLEEGLKFTFKIKNIPLYYEVEKFDIETKEIILNWKIDNDQYWLHYVIKKSGKYSKIKYKQIIFREKTFFGFQDTVGMYLYKSNFRKNIKSFNKSILYVKNNPNQDDD